jgi:hypothetical protein
MAEYRMTMLLRSAQRPRLLRRRVTNTSFRGNPYLFLGGRPFREARLRSYIVSQHRAGRPLASILGESFCWRVVQDPRTIEALERDVREAIERCRVESSTR